MATHAVEEGKGSGELEAASRRELVQRVIASHVFSKSERLSSFLAYVTELTLSGRSHEINEQRIGEAVFGRASNYDSSVDGIVRTQASRLRQRLEAYFNKDGADEPVIVVIPRGSYVPLFEPRKTEQQEAEPIPLEIAAPPLIPRESLGSGNASSPRSMGLKLAWGLVVLLSVALAVTVFLWRESWTRTGRSKTAMHPLWRVLFPPESRTLVVNGDSGVVIWQGITKQTIGLTDYLNGDYRKRTNSQDAHSPVDAVNLANRRYTSVVDVEISQAFTSIADAQHSKIEVRYARDIRPNDLKMGNLILVGAPEANPWVELFEGNMNFVFENDRIHQVASIINRSPRPGEAERWESAYGDVQRQVFGVVAFVPNLSDTGKILILEGTSMAGTECAWDFVSDDSQLLPFLDRIKRSDGSVPPFQVVLGTTNVGSSSVKSRILAWRTN